MIGIVPAAGLGTRMKPLAFSKELLPVGSQHGDGPQERPRAVSEYIVERMLRAGVERLCFVISPHKADILRYYGASTGGKPIAYVVQPEPLGLCDALFRAAPWIEPSDSVLVGLPDTIWFPVDAARELPDDRLAFLLFPVEQPEHFDAVICDAGGRVLEIQVKKRGATCPWIWGAFKLPGRVFHELAALWRAREPHDEYVGTLINTYLATGGTAVGVRAGQSYLDVGSVHGYRDAMHRLASDELPAAAIEAASASSPSSR